ncbi:hypothetical protein CCAL13119_03830 [Campylobacter sp. RM13119]|uniref:hypothetical protein n=1 Tax=Campylobacter californiensis TaxID=1032243 RepID=UPI001475C041|nr:hypothetical protein [Campylobacter sp. RM13119]MBE3606092.1 hypothetical protein [Campylobacter sp. RM13119]
MSNEIKKPKTYDDVVVDKILGVNTKIETSKPLECGAVLFSINGGESFTEVTSDNQTATIANNAAVFGVLCDNVSQSESANVLVLGEVELDDIASELKTALFKQKIIVR